MSRTDNCIVVQCEGIVYNSLSSSDGVNMEPEGGWGEYSVALARVVFLSAGLSEACLQSFMWGI